LIGASHFVYGFNDAELRRSGTHTPRQKHRRRSPSWSAGTSPGAPRSSCTRTSTPSIRRPCGGFAVGRSTT
jgi:hypothetical protein